MIKTQIVHEVDEQVNLDEKWLNTLWEKILNDNNKIDGEITIIISRDDKLRELKNIYFNQDVYTDVIAFNLEEKGKPIEGEVYISLERVKDNAQEFKQDIFIELKRVIIHGCLHLIGYEDDTSIEKNKMTSLENHYLNYSEHL